MSPRFKKVPKLSTFRKSKGIETTTSLDERATNGDPSGDYCSGSFSINSVTHNSRRSSPKIAKAEGGTGYHFASLCNSKCLTNARWVLITVKPPMLILDWKLLYFQLHRHQLLIFQIQVQASQMHHNQLQVQMNQLEAASIEEEGEPMSEDEILVCTLGRRSGYQKGMGGGREVARGSNHSNAQQDSKLIEKLEKTQKFIQQ